MSCRDWDEREGAKGDIYDIYDISMILMMLFAQMYSGLQNKWE